MHLVQHIRKGETTPMSIRRLAVLCTAMLCAGMLVLCRVFWIAADQSYAASAAAQRPARFAMPVAWLWYLCSPCGRPSAQ